MEVNQITKITLAWELFENGVPKSHIASQIGVHRETVGIWIDRISNHYLGLAGFLDDYLSCKKGIRAKRKLDPLIKTLVLLFNKGSKVLYAPSKSFTQMQFLAFIFLRASIIVNLFKGPTPIK